MITRKDRDGVAAFEEEVVSLEEAVRAYTLAGACASFEGEIKGSLAPGKLGDVTVLGTDLRSVAADEIERVSVDLTVLGGEVVHSR